MWTALEYQIPSISMMSVPDLDSLLSLLLPLGCISDGCITVQMYSILYYDNNKPRNIIVVLFSNATNCPRHACDMAYVHVLLLEVVINNIYACARLNQESGDSSILYPKRKKKRKLRHWLRHIIVRLLEEIRGRKRDAYEVQWEANEEAPWWFFLASPRLASSRSQIRELVLCGT